MAFLKLIDEARKALQASLRRLGLPELHLKLEPPPDPSFGDLSTSLAFEVSRILGITPLEAATKICDGIPTDNLVLIDRFEVAGGGYLNVRVKESSYLNSIVQLVKSEGDKYGSLPNGRLKILVEHTNSNPNKALHIGTIRNSILGDSVYRLLKFRGHEVQVVNYIDDSGAQVADNVVAHLFLGYPISPPNGEKYDHYCGRIYAEVNNRVQHDKSIEERRRLVLKMIEEGGNEASELAKEISKRVVEEQLKTCWKLGIYFDLLNWESDIIRYGFLGKVMERLMKLGIAVKETTGPNAGCMVIKVGRLPEFKELTNPDEVLIRSDGTATYVAKDIAYACWKLGWLGEDFRYEIWGTQPNGQKIWTTTFGEGVAVHPDFGNVDKAITFVDKRQEYAQKVVKYATEQLGTNKKEYIHFSYEVVSLSRKTAEKISKEKLELENKKIIHMAGRKGLVVNADDVLDALERLVEQETKKRNPDASQEWVKRVTRSIAAGALRYAIVKPDVNKLLVFDMEKTVKLEGDTGPYLQYTYARANNIIEKAQIDVENLQFKAELLTPDEAMLIKTIGKLPWTILEASESMSPRLVAIYAHKLADQFNNFYEKYQVIRAESPELRATRLVLVKTFLQAMKNTLTVIGIEPLESM
ncbi:MAG: arginine--tRNA ligase [Thermoproteota archaeon]